MPILQIRRSGAAKTQTRCAGQLKHYLPDERFMSAALAAARKAMANGQTPFGCCIVRNGKIVARAHNNVWGNTDSTAHAEVNAIRQACRKLRTIDLVGCTLYSTCEPCPMCFGACHWARVTRVVFGARISDARAAGFHELGISVARMNKAGGNKIRLTGGILRDKALALFREWAERPDARSY